nr:translation initiation factor IF-2-like [Chlorocebus sabaeus]
MAVNVPPRYDKIYNFFPLSGHGEQVHSPPRLLLTGAGPARQVKVLRGPRRPACAQTPAPPPPGGKDPAGLPGTATPAAHGASAGRAARAGGGGAPAGRGEGRAGPADVSDLGAGRPPLPRCAAPAPGAPHRSPGRRRGSPACGQERPSGATGLGKVCARSSAPRPRAEETQSRPRARPGTATRESRGSAPRKNSSGNNRRPEREQEGGLLWKQMSPVPPTYPKSQKENLKGCPPPS